MKNIFFICLCALFAFTGCADDDDDLLTGGNVDIDLLPDSKPNDVVNTNVFDIINLNYPGLEKVKEFNVSKYKELNREWEEEYGRVMIIA